MIIPKSLFLVFTFFASLSLYEGKAPKVFSSVDCSPSQLLDNDDLGIYIGSNPTIGSPDIRVCHFQHMCFVDGEFHFYVPERVKNHSWPNEFFYNSFSKSFIKVGTDREHLLPQIKMKYYPLPSALPYDASEVGFWLGHSNSYNYGHYILDTVMNAHIAAQVFNFNFSNGRQLFESSCHTFGTNEHAGDRTVPFNASMGTFRDACLDRINSFWPYFFNYAPSYLESLYLSNRCYKNVLVGMGTAYNYLRHLPTRGKYLRDFREYLLTRLSFRSDVDRQGFSALELIRRKKKVVLVALRSAGHAGKDIVSNLCGMVDTLLNDTMSYYQSTDFLDEEDKQYFSGWKASCFYPQDVSLIDEITLARNSPIIVSVHGTISFVSLFARDESHHIVLSEPRQSTKEFFSVFHSTTVRAHRIPWDTVQTNLVEQLKYSMESIYAKYLVYLMSRSNSSSSSNHNNNNVLPSEEKLAWTREHRDKLEHRPGPFYQMVPRDGIVLQVQRQPSLYLMVQGHKRLIMSYDLYLGVGSPPIFKIRSHELDAIPSGPNLYNSTLEF